MTRDELSSMAGEKKKTQLGLKLDEEHSEILSQVKDWAYGQPAWEFDGKFYLSDDAGTETTLAKTLLYGALQIMRREMELDDLIEQAAQCWCDPYWRNPGLKGKATPAAVARFWLEQGHRKLPSEVLNYVIEEGQKRSAEMLRLQDEADEAEQYAVTSSQLMRQIANKITREVSEEVATKNVDKATAEDYAIKDFFDQATANVKAKKARR